MQMDCSQNVRRPTSQISTFNTRSSRLLEVNPVSISYVLARRLVVAVNSSQVPYFKLCLVMSPKRQLVTSRLESASDFQRASIMWEQNLVGLVQLNK